MTDFKILENLMHKYEALDAELEPYKVKFNEQKRVLERLKTEFKKHNIKVHTLTQDDGRTLIHSFKVGKVERVNISAMPNDLKDLYRLETEVWRFNSTKF